MNLRKPTPAHTPQTVHPPPSPGAQVTPQHPRLPAKPGVPRVVRCAQDWHHSVILYGRRIS